MNIRYATEADTPTLAEINIVSFQHGPFYRATFRNVDPRVAIPMKHARGLSKLTNPRTHLLVATDAAEQILGTARWLFPASSPARETGAIAISDEGRAKAAQVEELRPQGMNLAVYEEFLKVLEETRATHAKEDDIMLELLATYPQHQGKGVGSALLRWGLQKANEIGARIYLEATDEGYPLYCRYGFTEIGEIVMDYSVYGGDGSQRYVVMVRDPDPVSTEERTE
ncbi:GNAT family N-acetyltransferase [Aspergillus clavatus NRRL 1]|uniref:GNAT family acetyltransferase, putative n=1 Tax=Aspergillus clavatus (strain ATCC 1007 / CBS 513.65 / DSM 816 / NCTC 3887 / NRRL 1 / QM 1276 / 107) TaxID=344612 RepID=A1CHQ6_ASPCL|nr:GNAT family acetyltransferase, putative [Aspergillus clavatus NRRL 1]EAW10411.1 GNAT family acetyltransferase, putative [Aspergillus clavatus NRRL 1]